MALGSVRGNSDQCQVSEPAGNEGKPGRCSHRRECHYRRGRDLDAWDPSRRRCTNRCRSSGSAERGPRTSGGRQPRTSSVMAQRIRFLDLTRLHQSIRQELDEAIDRVIIGSAFIGGEEVQAFEQAFAATHESPAAVGCGSGTDALALTLRALGVGPGDEVIVPSMTFVATAEAVVHTGATPVLADVDRDTLLLSPDDVERVRTSRTVAVVPVHLYGHIVPFEAIDGWKDAGLLVVEDAAQAHLGASGGEYVGSRSDAACFSFYPGKNLGGFGDGGMVVSRDESVIGEVRRLRDHGRISKYTHDVPGWCSRLDGLQAAILRTKLPHLQDWTEARRVTCSTVSRASWRASGAMG
jgi:dTDP-4-amino-4,6-dideoxygalactose transaminase